MCYNHLVHHGIKGQKWGVRRYQYKDGSLTTLGKTMRLMEARNPTDIRTSLKNNKNLKIGEYDDVLKKKQDLERVANSGEPINKKRKYVSFDNDDVMNYREAYQAIGLNPNKPISSYRYSSEIDLKIANGKNVTKHVLDEYGDEPITIIEKGLFSNKKFTTLNKAIDQYYKSEESLGFRQYGYSKEYKRANDVLHEVMSKHINEISEHYSKLGYNAFCDIEDRLNGVAKYPLVVVNPARDLKLKQETKWKDEF